MDIQRLLNNDLSIVVGMSNVGKSLLLYQLIAQYKAQYKGEVWVYGMNESITDKLKVKSFRSLLELEKITNSIVIVDEVGTLFDLEDRKQRKQIETILRLVNHNGNKILLSGLPFDFKKFLCAKAKVFIFKALNITDMINGSLAKEIITQYKGEEKGIFSLQIPVGEALVYDGNYHTETFDYNKDYDTKLKNVDLFVQKVFDKK